MTEISRLTHIGRLTSQPKVYLEQVGSVQNIEATAELRELKQIANELEQLQQGIATVNEIRKNLELALQSLLPNE